MKLLERECRREKTLESRSKDNKANKDRLNRSNAAIATSSNNTEDNKTPMFLFEPPTDAPADAPALSHIASEIGDNQLRVAEELFFDIIHQVNALPFFWDALTNFFQKSERSCRYF